MLKLKLLGGLSLTGEAVPAAAFQRRRLALLAVLAIGGRRGVSRDRVQAYLWPDSAAERARHALDQLLYATRRDVGRDVIVSGTSDLRLNPDRVQPDIWEFDEAIDSCRWLDAVAVYDGPVLQGFHLIDENEFEQWLDAERARCQQDYHRALEALARTASACGSHEAAVGWWRQRAASDPFSAAVALDLMRALVAADDGAGALQHARAYEEIVRTSLEIEPDERVVAFANSITKPASPHSIAVPAELAASTPTINAQPLRRLRSSYRLITTGAFAVVLGIAITVAWSAQSKPPANASTGTADAQTHSLYLRARADWNKRTEAGLKNAVVLFRRAIEREPAYAPAYTGLAEAYAMLGYFGFESGEAMFPKARAAALRALELDSTQGGAYAALGQVLSWEHAWAKAEQAYRRGLQFSPNDPTVHQWYGLLLAYLGRAHEAAVHTGHASRLDPLSVQINNMYGMMLYYDGDLAGSLQQYERTVIAEPDSAWVRENPWVLSNYGHVAGKAGQRAHAVRLIERALQVVPTHPRPLLDLAGVYATAGEPEHARAVFARADTTHPHYAIYRAQFHAQIGELDEAFAWFDRVQEWALPSLIGLNNEPHYATLRADPRYSTILQRVGMTNGPGFGLRVP